MEYYRVRRAHLENGGGGGGDHGDDNEDDDNFPILFNVMDVDGDRDNAHGDEGADGDDDDVMLVTMAGRHEELMARAQRLAATAATPSTVDAAVAAAAAATGGPPSNAGLGLRGYLGTGEPRFDAATVSAIKATGRQRFRVLRARPAPWAVENGDAGGNRYLMCSALVMAEVEIIDGVGKNAEPSPLPKDVAGAVQSWREEREKRRSRGMRRLGNSRRHAPRRANVTAFPLSAWDAADAAALARRCCDSLALRRGGDARINAHSWPAPAKQSREAAADTPFAFSLSVAAGLPVSDKQRQAMLAASSAAARLRICLEVLRPRRGQRALCGRGGGGGGFVRRGSSSGRRGGGGGGGEHVAAGSSSSSSSSSSNSISGENSRTGVDGERESQRRRIGTTSEAARAAATTTATTIATATASTPRTTTVAATFEHGATTTTATTTAAPSSTSNETSAGQTAPASATSLRCRRCSAVVADTVDLFDYGDLASVATFSNGAGALHSVMTLKTVRQSSLLPVSVPTMQDTWFPGYAWTILRCRCGNHAGWLYTAIDEHVQPRTFYGIVRSNVHL